MKEEEFCGFRVGDEVIAIDKSVGGVKENSSYYKSHHPTYVSNIKDRVHNSRVITVSHKNSMSGGYSMKVGDYFLPSDLKHVNPPATVEIDKMFEDLINDII